VFTVLKTEKERQLFLKMVTVMLIKLPQGEETKHLGYNTTDNADCEKEPVVKSSYFRRKKESQLTSRSTRTGSCS